MGYRKEDLSCLPPLPVPIPPDTTREAMDPALSNPCCPTPAGAPASKLPTRVARAAGKQALSSPAQPSAAATLPGPAMSYSPTQCSGAAMPEKFPAAESSAEHSALPAGKRDPTRRNRHGLQSENCNLCSLTALCNLLSGVRDFQISSPRLRVPPSRHWSPPGSGSLVPDSCIPTRRGRHAGPGPADRTPEIPSIRHGSGRGCCFQVHPRTRRAAL